MTKIIRKALFPVAGLGTRFLPATKATPKEMLPVVDKPLIQYAVEEAVNAGITELIFITSRMKRSIKDHFDKNHELEDELYKRGKNELLALVRDILPKHVNCIYLRQTEPLGLGHAVLCGRVAVDDEPFAVLLADELLDDGGRGCLARMIDIFQEYQGSIIAVADVPREDTAKYGIIESHLIKQQIGKISNIVEKPEPAEAPSTQAVIGRYIFSPGIFNLLNKVDADIHGEIQLTAAISLLLGQEPVYSYLFRGGRYDCGAKQGYLQAIIEYALKHPQLQQDFKDYLRNNTHRFCD